jgi:hypothetical protein
MAPQAMVMKTKGKSWPLTMGAKVSLPTTTALDDTALTSGISITGFTRMMPTTRSAMVPILR